MALLITLIGCGETRSAPNQENTIQVTAPKGHVLNFSKNQIVIVAADHMYKLSFIGANLVQPISENTNLDHHLKSKPQAFQRVDYHNLWPGISVVYEAKPNMIYKSTYHIEAGSSKKQLHKLNYATIVNYNWMALAICL